jgi:flagellar hook-associated protein 2
MATTGAVGGSQIDVQSLVSQLVAAERAPMDRQVARQSERVTTQISAVGVLMGAMSQFRSSLASLKTEDVFATRKVTSGDTGVFTASATSSAAPGTYSIEVEQLATAQQISSNPFADGADHVVGTGKLTISLGDKEFSIEIDSANSSLAKIRNAINDASGNPGVHATLIHGEGGTRLILTSAATGAENVIGVKHANGDGGLSAIAYDDNDSEPANYERIAQAQDAIVHIANATVTNKANTITGAIDGVTLSLVAKSEEDEPTTLTIGYDKAGVTTRVNNFVNAYNALASQISRLRSYDAATEKAGPMLGDSLLTGIESQMRRTISGRVEGASQGFDTLASIGITTTETGTLAVDSAKLDAAFSKDFGAVSRLFGSEQGIGAKLFGQMEERLKTGGAVDSRSKLLVEQQRDIEDQVEAVDARMAAKQKAYMLQFTRLDTLLSQLQVTSSYLSQQIDSLPKMNAR